MLYAIRIGTHAEKKVVKEFKDSFNVLMVNANIVAHTLDSMAAFLGFELGKSFVIDPQTYAFQNRDLLLSKSEGRGLKSSISKLIGHYGPQLNDILTVQNRSLLPSDFAGPQGEEFIKQLCTNVIDFQLKSIQNALLQNQEYNEYIQFIQGHEGMSPTQTPLFVVPPYFYIQTATLDTWLHVNIQFLHEALKQYPSAPISAQLVINKDILLDSMAIKKIVNKYSSVEVNNIFLWIDDFNEKEASERLLEGFAILLQSLKKKNKMVFNLYGGFFSMLLAKNQFLLAGVCNGMEYGESRAVFPVGGGFPIAKFYLPALHERILYRVALQTLDEKDYLTKEKYYTHVCNCKTCKELLQNNPKANFEKYGESEAIIVEQKKKNGIGLRTLSFPTIKTKNNCLKHYLHAKEEEAERIDSSSIKELLAHLETSFHDYSHWLGDSIIYLKVWKKALEEYYFKQKL